MALYPSIIVQIESINKEVVDGINEAINEVFDAKIPKLKQSAQEIIDIKDRIDTGLMRKSVNSGFVKFENISTLFLEDSAIREGKKTDYVSFQEFGTVKIKPALFLTGSFDKNTKDIPELIDEKTQKQMDKI